MYKPTKVENPLTLIAIFSGITEVAASSVLPFISEDIQRTFIWFLIGFPIFLVLLFFGTLNLNPKVLYTPKDYKDESNFLRTLNVINEGREIKLTAASSEEIPKLEVPQSTDKDELENYTKEEIVRFNLAFGLFAKKTNTLFESETINGMSGGIVGDHLFSIIVTYETERGQSHLLAVIRIDKIGDDLFQYRAIGERVSSNTPDEFSEKLYQNFLRRIKVHQRKNS